MATDDELQATHATAFNTLLDEEGVCSEEKKQLQGSVSAFKGLLTRAYKDIRLLCSNSGLLSDIVKEEHLGGFIWKIRGGSSELASDCGGYRGKRHELVLSSPQS